MPGVIDELLRSEEPSIRWLVRRDVLGEDPDSPRLRRLRSEIRRSPRVTALLASRDDRGRMASRVYNKWQGAHWVLASLADLGYPPGDRGLEPLRDQVLDSWLHPRYTEEFEASGRSGSYRKQGVPVIAGRARRCASQHGNALRAVERLGLHTERCDSIVELLRHWQWPDGGWNCDRDPDADTSSFVETLLAMRGLAAYADGGHDGTGAATRTAQRTARRAAEVFLSRRLFRRRRDGAVMRRDFTLLHQPLYWHYDVLGGLVGLVEAGLIGDPRGAEALDLLESKRRPDGGWPAEASYHRGVASTVVNTMDWVDWGASSTVRRNEWVTVRALGVLRAAGRL